MLLFGGVLVVVGFFVGFLGGGCVVEGEECGGFGGGFVGYSYVVSVVMEVVEFLGGVGCE